VPSSQLMSILTIRSSKYLKVSGTKTVLSTSKRSSEAHLNETLNQVIVGRTISSRGGPFKKSQKVQLRSYMIYFHHKLIIVMYIIWIERYTTTCTFLMQHMPYPRMYTWCHDNTLKVIF
jgi:hypothetical protein